ncbi:MAG: helix-turn-helix transcriptional regulator [Actinomycetota bacterium]|nr:helix-turn-helix transcriptional regulator [Actinomycetota bacterium]
MNRVGFRLRQFRQLLRMSLTDVNESTGISRAQISLIENGKADPRMSTVMRLLHCYGRGLADLEPSPPERLHLEDAIRDAHRASARLTASALGPSDPRSRLDRKEQLGQDVRDERAALATRR